jgi:DNA-directed RNA polymerase specialized sigma24 family protein
MAMDHERSEDFAKFYATARPGCFRAIRAAVADPGQAQELTAEAFARAFAY